MHRQKPLSKKPISQKPTPSVYQEVVAQRFAREEHERFTDLTVAQAKWCTVYRETWNMSAACAAIGVPRQRVKDWVASDPDFAAAFEEAEHWCRDNLKGIVYREATKAKPHPLLLMFAVKSAFPEFKDSYQPVVEQPKERTIRFMTPTERDAATQGQYRLLEKHVPPPEVDHEEATDALFVEMPEATEKALRRERAL